MIPISLFGSRYSSPSVNIPFVIDTNWDPHIIADSQIPNMINPERNQSWDFFYAFCNWRLNFFVRVLSIDCDIFLVTVCVRIVYICFNNILNFSNEYWFVLLEVIRCDLLNYRFNVLVLCVSPIVSFCVFRFCFL